MPIDPRPWPFYLILLLSLAFTRDLRSADNELTAAERRAGWILLFDGQSLNGWMTSGGKPSRTPVQEGCINPHGCGDYMLVHTQQWSDCVLALDFKLSPGCNSGIFLRTYPLTPLPGKDVGYNGLEVQLIDSTTAGYQDTGAVYDLSKPTRNAMRPAGEWNHMEITSRANQIEVRLNGEMVNRVDLDQFTTPNRRPDGSEHKFAIAYNQHPRRGYIGLQDHGSDCWFKNIKLLAQTPPAALAEFFTPPEMYRSDLGHFRSPLTSADGTPVRDAADWKRRREEILATWHQLMGPWPPLIQNPRLELVNTIHREDVVQHQLRVEIALGGDMVDALLLVPDAELPTRKRPAVLVVYYDAETGVGLGAPLRDYGWQLAKRGFVTLSIGKPNARIDLTSTNKPRTEPYLGPVGQPVRVQPLSALAYAAANAHTVLARRPEVDPARIGIIGHSFGGKWAMFASCLYDKFACAVWSDPGIVFDERDRRKQNPSGSVNYWDVWYLGFELGAVADPKGAGPFRRLPSEGQLRTGAYQALVDDGHDLVELHALMAPRPFLVSGGTADLPERWPALNHAIAVNRLLGYAHRVAMTPRDGHAPTPAANEQAYRFLEWCLNEAR